VITISGQTKILELPDYPIPPGETLKETLAIIGMKQTELAQRMNRPIKTINEIIHGKTAITADTALQLERVLGVSSELWLNLEANYQMIKARIEAKKRLAREIRYIDVFPYAEMAKRGWVKKTRDKFEKASELLSFFGIVSFSNFKMVSNISYRKSARYRASPASLTAWLRYGEISAQKIKVAKYDKNLFQDTLASIKGFTRNIKEGFAVELQDMCAKAGVAVVFVEHLKHTYVNGATRWLTPDKALIQFSIRYKYRDIFWFTFFHEAAHILLHGKSDEFIDLSVDQVETSKEIEANNWASDFLINRNDYAEFCDNAAFTRQSIIEFAEKQNVAPEIVIGRLQHDQYISYAAFANLRPKLKWADN
jgi:HTH-type transcriptional regulator/antitoxin HigA